MQENMVVISKGQIKSINISGLGGRMLEVPAKKASKTKDILLVYGVHSSIERMYSTAQFHSNYGNVISPDLPGFGGMDSFYKIGLEPTLDSYADYLYTFVKTYKLNDKKIRIVAMSFGFLVATRMLQKYPELIKNIEFVVSFVGFGKTSDFNYPALENPFYRFMMKVGSTKTGSRMISIVVFNRFSLKVMFRIFRSFNPKYDHKNAHDRDEAIEMELELWTKNDTRTKFFTYKLLGELDLTKGSKKLDLELYDIVTPSDQYFDDKSVSKTLAKLYKKTSTHTANMKLHAPSVIGDEAAVFDIYPSSIKKILNR